MKRRAHFACGEGDAPPDATEVAQIEDVMEVAWSWEHLSLDGRPNESCQWDEGDGELLNFPRKATIHGEVPHCDSGKDGVD